MKMVKINRQCSGESATLLKGTELTELCGQNQSTTLGWIRYSPEENWIGRVIWSESIGNAGVNLLLSWRELNCPSYVVRINRNARVNPLLSWRELNWPSYMVRINRQCSVESATLLKGTIWAGCDDRVQKINSLNLSIAQDLGAWFTSKCLHSRSILR